MPTHPLPPPQIGGYKIVRTLASMRSYVAIAPNGRHVVLKMLESDCLLHEQLHPSIRERLARVRELAHPAVANLHGVERDRNLIYLVWEYIEGQTLSEALRRRRGSSERLVLVRDAALAVESLHALGIVHGAVHERNVIVAADGRVKLTHISPLLFSDVAEDAAAILRLLRQAVGGQELDGLDELFKAAGKNGSVPLRQVRTKLAALTEPRSVPAPSRSPLGRDEEDIPLRRRARYSALAVALIGAVTSAGVWFFARQSTPRPPAPLEADPAALYPPATQPTPTAGPSAAPARIGFYNLRCRPPLRSGRPWICSGAVT